MSSMFVPSDGQKRKIVDQFTDRVRREIRNVMDAFDNRLDDGKQSYITQQTDGVKAEVEKIVTIARLREMRDQCAAWLAEIEAAQTAYIDEGETELPKPEPKAEPEA